MRLWDIRANSGMTRAPPPACPSVRQNTCPQYETGQRQRLIRLAKYSDNTADCLPGLTGEKTPYPRTKRKRISMALSCQKGPRRAVPFPFGLIPAFPALRNSP